MMLACPKCRSEVNQRVTTGPSRRASPADGSDGRPTSPRRAPSPPWQRARRHASRGRPSGTSCGSRPPAAGARRSRRRSAAAGGTARRPRARRRRHPSRATACTGGRGGGGTRRGLPRSTGCTGCGGRCPWRRSRRSARGCGGGTGSRPLAGTARRRGASVQCGPSLLGLVDVTPAVNALEAAGIAFTIHEYDHDPAARSFGSEAAAVLRLDPDQVFKTLLVTADGEQAVGIVPVSCTLSLKAVGAVLGRKRVEMCDPAVAQRVTGYVLGGISPFGQRKQLSTVIDETAELYETIYVSGGRRGLDLGVAPTDLIATLEAKVWDIVASP